MKAGDLMAEALSRGQVRRHDLSLILAEILGCRPLEIPLLKEKELSDPEVGLFWQYYNRLENDEPPQYILGKSWFYGLEMTITPDVLIPRPETEGLVEIALRHAKPGMKILEIGTGSGCIAVALKKNLPDARITATDIAPQALAVAEQNAARHSCEIDFRLCDLFPARNALFELIISNPPYIAPREYAQLEPRVRDYEPRQALYAGENGLEIFRRILQRAPQHLAGQGLTLLEHGAFQRKTVTGIAEECGFFGVFSGNDLAGRERYLLLGRSSH